MAPCFAYPFILRDAGGERLTTAPSVQSAISVGSTARGEEKEWAPSGPVTSGMRIIVPTIETYLALIRSISEMVLSPRSVLSRRASNALIFLAFCLVWLHADVAFAQTSQAILIDGDGPWRDSQWIYTAQQFRSMLEDAGYTVTTMAPTDLDFQSPRQLGDVLLAAPSLETLPATTGGSISAYLQSAPGGSLMASGGEPFRNILYPGPDGTWLDAAAYAPIWEATHGGAFHAYEAPRLTTISPSSAQYTTSSGTRVPYISSRGISGGRGVQDDRQNVMEPAATIYTSVQRPSPAMGPSLPSPGSRGRFIMWLPTPTSLVRTEPRLWMRCAERSPGCNCRAQAPRWFGCRAKTITGQATVINMSDAPKDATLQWSISDGSVLHASAAGPHDRSGI